MLNGRTNKAMNKTKQEQNGFSLIELMVVVAIILTIAAIAIPNLLHARIAANEASAVGSLRTINAAMIAYNLTYPAVGYASQLSVLGSSPCNPNPTTPCLLDGLLAGGTKSGYKFTAIGAGGPPANKYYATAVPISPNFTHPKLLSV
jgi:type IV pilus assembly protein PilA